jgi:tRNA threonylcarbamoyladenosine biosynthesis protein TsaE
MKNNSFEGIIPVPGTYRMTSLMDTEAWGAGLARSLKSGDVVYLIGALGAGKSSLCRSIIRTLVEDVEEIPSPTFSLIQTYEARNFLIHHLDLYRLGDPEDTLELGLDELGFGSILLIEWPDRLGPYGFDCRQEIEIVITDTEGGRDIILNDQRHFRRQTL